MKKYIIFILLSVMILSISGCVNIAKNQDSNSENISTNNANIPRQAQPFQYNKFLRELERDIKTLDREFLYEQETKEMRTLPFYTGYDLFRFERIPKKKDK